MRSSLFKPLFWLGFSIMILVCIFAMLISPIVGILLLLLFALIFVLLVLFVPSLGQAIKPAPKPNKNPNVIVRDDSQPKMMLESCSSENQNIIIDRPMFVVGRAPDSDFVFRDTNGISFHHCRITYRETTRQFFIEDLGSSFGTYLNGRRLNKNNPVPLQKNSNVAFHTHRFTFKSIF